MIRKLTAVLAALPLVACSTGAQYYQAVSAAHTQQTQIERARATAEAERYRALARIAETGDTTAKTAAVMALALGGKSAGTAVLTTPAPHQSEALQWASILAPTITQGLSIYHNARVQMRQSDNSAVLGLSTNNTFARFAAEIAKPPVVVEQPKPIIVPTPAPVIVRPEIVKPEVVKESKP